MESEATFVGISVQVLGNDTSDIGDTVAEVPELTTDCGGVVLGSGVFFADTELK